jgi:hypothetical protein
MALFAKPPFMKSRPAVDRGEAPFVVPVHHIPPTPREMRAQAVHRLQVGLFGLAGMLLLVSLANVIMERAQLSDSAAINAPNTAVSSSAANDPLVDMGVAPELPVGDGANAKKPAPQRPH